MHHKKMITASLLSALLFSDSAVADAYQKALEQIQKETGLAPIQIPNTEGAYLGKKHRGYEVIYTAKAGNVWGRYAARLTMGEIGREVGAIYSADAQFAARLLANKELMNRMKNLRCQYIRLDADAVTFLWSGSEKDYSGMISDHGGYSKMLNAIMDDLADIADAIPTSSSNAK
jgi:hypothetical protein